MTSVTSGERPTPRDAETKRRMQAQRRSSTAPELGLRRALHAKGWRYRVDHQPQPLAGSRRRADIVFTRRKVAVFVDGCFWHACPLHATKPKSNADWWAAKLAGNVERDRNTDRRLEEAGWTVVRVWEHETVDEAVRQVEAALRTTE